MKREVELRAVETYYWSTRALAWGVDTGSGERVTFAVGTGREAELRQLLETKDAPVVYVSDLDVLFARSD